METDVKTKQSIEEAAEQLLIWKVKGKGKEEISQIIDDPYLLACGIQYLINKDYLVPIWDAQECLDYLIMPKGLEHVYN